MVHDIIITGCLIAISAGLVPQVWRNLWQGCDISYWTAIPTTLALYIMAAVFLDMDLWFSFGINTLAASLWLAITVQRRLTDTARLPISL